MIRLARRWFNFVADYHRERMLDHSRRRDRALRTLERMERRELQRQVQDELERSDIARLRKAWKYNASRPQIVMLPPFMPCGCGAGGLCAGHRIGIRGTDTQ